MSFRKRLITLNCLLIVLHTFNICLEKFSLLSISIPKISKVSFTGQENPFEYRTSAEHANADGLSRLVQASLEEQEEEEEV